MKDKKKKYDVNIFAKKFGQLFGFIRPFFKKLNEWYHLAKLSHYAWGYTVVKE